MLGAAKVRFVDPVQTNGIPFGSPCGRVAVAFGVAKDAETVDDNMEVVGHRVIRELDIFDVPTRFKALWGLIRNRSVTYGNVGDDDRFRAWGSGLKCRANRCGLLSRYRFRFGLWCSFATLRGVEHLRLDLRCTCLGTCECDARNERHSRQ